MFLLTFLVVRGRYGGVAPPYLPPTIKKVRKNMCLTALFADHLSLGALSDSRLKLLFDVPVKQRK